MRRRCESYRQLSARAIRLCSLLTSDSSEWAKTTMTKQEARQVTAACVRFRSAKTVADKEEALNALKSLADQGNVIALHELGQWQSEGERESDRDQGLTLHMRAAEL